MMTFIRVKSVFYHPVLTAIAFALVFTLSCSSDNAYRRGSYETKISNMEDITEAGFVKDKDPVSNAEASFFAMAKSSEVCLQRGYKFFTLVDSDNYSEDYVAGYSGSATTSGAGMATTAPIRIVGFKYSNNIKMYKTLEEITTGVKYYDAEAIWNEYLLKYEHNPLRDHLPKESKFGVNAVVGFGAVSGYNKGGYNYYGNDLWAIVGSVDYEIPFNDGWLSIAPNLELVSMFGTIEKECHWSSIKEKENCTADEKENFKLNLGINLPLRINVWRLYFQGGPRISILPLGIGLDGGIFGWGYRWNKNLNFELNFRFFGEAMSEGAGGAAGGIGVNYQFDWFSKLKTLKE